MSDAVRIDSVQKLNEVLADGERRDFFISLNGGIRSYKNIAFDGEHYCINNEIDDSHQDLTPEELMDETETNIGRAITAGAFYMYGYSA